MRYAPLYYPNYKVEISNGTQFIFSITYMGLSQENGQMSQENAVELDDDEYFVMGDNRNISKDSRNPEIGLIDKREVLGKAVYLMIPGTNEGREPRLVQRKRQARSHRCV